MKDTHHIIAHKMKTLMKQKSGEKRLMMGFSMFKTAQKLVLSSLFFNSQRPNTLDLRKALFLRFYRNDFSPEIRKKIFRFWLDHT